VFGASLDFRLWLALVEEEMTELEAAINSEPKENILKEFSDVIYVSVPFTIMAKALHAANMLSNEDLTRVAAVTGRLDALDTYLNSTFTLNAIQEALRRVHLSNMSKLGEDGKPIRREDGKIMKGPNYQPPFLKDLVQ
jgi:uncharacterized membrane protein